MKREEVIKVLKDGVYYDSIDVGDLIIKSDKYVYGYSDECPDIKEYVKAWAFMYDYDNTAPNKFYENSEAGNYDFLTIWNDSANVSDFMDHITSGAVLDEDFDVTREKEIKELTIKTFDDVDFFLHTVSCMKHWGQTPHEMWKAACKIAGIQPGESIIETFEALSTKRDIVL